MNSARRTMGCGADNTSALAFGGSGPTAATESWNGSAWTEVADLNTARLGLKGSGSANTDAVAFGGNQPPPNSALTEVWNGTAWTEQGDLSNARKYLASTKGSSTAALAMGGGSSTNVESFTGAGANSPVDFTVS